MSAFREVFNLRTCTKIIIIIIIIIIVIIIIIITIGAQTGHTLGHCACFIGIYAQCRASVPPNRGKKVEMLLVL